MKYLFFILFCLSSLAAGAQHVRKGIMVEFGGVSQEVGLAYDARWRCTPHLGYKIGIAHVSDRSSYNWWASTSGTTNGWMLNGQQHVLLGGKKHNLEVGVGAAVGWFQSYYYDMPGGILGEYESGPVRKDPRKQRSPLNWCITNTYAYRFQMQRGAFFRVGLTFNFNVLNKGHEIVDENNAFPFFSFGVAL